ncbi:Alpha-tubulin suppressor [Microbacterium sp. ru370.1]|nr:Alpha-tubulin suppressor [Microbacterium sp. ru370.1]SIT93254.1 Alpha-tubulin suppressor [Microbacterium sp. RU1D]
MDSSAVPRPSDPAPHTPGAVRRRTLMTTAAWSVPAVTMSVATPAFAASATRVLSLSSQNDQLPAAGGAQVSATLVDANGSPIVGQAVSFSGSSTATFTPATATTNAGGVATTTVDLNDTWATPGSATTITASTVGLTQSKAFTVLGANVLAFGRGYSSTPTQAELVFPSPVAQISGGSTDSAVFAAALLENGTVWTKGSNSQGQLGDGTTTDRATWAQVPGLSGVTQIVVGDQSVAALRSDGTVMRWGSDPYDTTSSPKQQAGLSGVIRIARSNTAGFAVLGDGSVKVWGSNQNHVAGTGEPSSSWPGTTPRQVGGLTSGVADVVGGLYSGYARMTDGTVRAWGWNAFGQLGDGTTTERETDVLVNSLTGSATQVVTQAVNLIVLRSDGSVLSCGWNDADGEMGNGTTSPSANPSLVAVSSLTSGVSAITALNSSGFALLSDGSVRGWGWNAYGQLGDGTTTSQLTPKAISLPAGRTVARLAESSQSSYTMFLVTTTS